MWKGTPYNINTADRKDGAQATREKICFIDISIITIGLLNFFNKENIQDKKYHLP